MSSSDAPRSPTAVTGTALRGASRRALLAGGLGAAAFWAGLAAAPGRARAAEVLKIGVLKFGTVSWEMDVIRRHGLDRANGFSLEAVELASNDATKIALQARAVDMIVSDWLWVTRQRSEGVPLTFVPFTTSLGAVMVAESSPARSLADLQGKAIGVAGGPLDKSWLMVLALARRQGLDLARAARPVYGAPPLLAEKLASGELDAALLFWNFSAKLETQGFRRLLPMEDVEKALGAREPVGMVGYTFFDDLARTRPAVAEGFLKATTQAKAIMRTSDAEWEALRPLVKAEDEAIFLKLRDRFREGIPGRRPADEHADAARLYEVMVEIGGEKLVGRATTLVDGTFYRPPGS
ncbi:ABC transporter substrate-binding protein [Alsobacter sp. R-9]